jgi:hypothetical protein
MMRNFCGECGDILLDPIEFRWGLCVWCLSIKLEKMDVALTDYYWDDDGEPI